MRAKARPKKQTYRRRRSNPTFTRPGEVVKVCLRRPMLRARPSNRHVTGNMATNLKSHPELARAAQDVEAPAAHQKEQRGTYHWGRGGEGNVMTVGGGDKKEKERNSSKGPERRGSFQGAIEKGKEMLGLGKKGGKSDKEKEREKGGEESAIAD